MKGQVIGMNMDVADVAGLPCYCLRPWYVKSVLAAGGFPLIVPPGDRRVQETYLRQVNGFLFTGGRDYPPAAYGEPQDPRTELMSEERSAADLALAAMVLERGLPVLAICGGHQLVSISLGGKLIQHVEQAAAHRPEQYHTVHIVGGRILKALFGLGPIAVNSIHHQAVDPRAVGRGLEVTALAEDGTVEAIESTDDRFLLGLQWHPERIRDEEHRRKVFGAFVRASGGGDRR
jgi:gamma-glutamyl-gamma-aminobutyrate hydrolase PuuD